MNQPWELISTLLVGSGLGAAAFNAWSKVRVKKIDVAFEERKEFVTEVRDLRKQVTELFKIQYDLMKENASLKITVNELKNHVNHKSEIINQLKDFIKEYNDSDYKDAADKFISKVIELVD